ncbi:MAG: type I CRISPR-associated protein Cas7 [Thermodesulfobacteriota bacterium]
MTDQSQSNENTITLHHNLIKIPDGKKPRDVVGERHDIVLLTEVVKSNPNGDPDTGNMPRLQPDTMKGLMTDGCQKRKIRNFFTLYNPDSSLRMEDAGWQEGWRIFIREGAILQEQIENPDVNSLAEAKFKKWLMTQIPGEYRPAIIDALAGVEPQTEQDKKVYKEIAKKYLAAWKEGKIPKSSKVGSDSESDNEALPSSEENEGKKGKKKKENPLMVEFDKVLKRSPEYRERFLRDALCATYFDVRFFGGVVSTEGPLKGSFYGQIRGPIQFGFAESLDRVYPLDFTITRCASASDKDANQSGEGEGESESGGNRTMGRKHVVDYGIYRSHIYLSPAFAAKTGFTYYDLDNFLFALQHIYTDDRSAARPGGMRVVGLVDFQHSTPLGNEHAHKLFEMVKVHRADLDEGGNIKKEFPQSIADYCGEAPDGAEREKDQGGQGKELVTVHRIIWDIPQCQGKCCPS